MRRLCHRGLDLGRDVALDVLEREVGPLGALDDVEIRPPGRRARLRLHPVDLDAFALERLDEVEVVDGDVHLLLLDERGVRPQVGRDGADVGQQGPQREEAGLEVRFATALQARQLHDERHAQARVQRGQADASFVGRVPEVVPRARRRLDLLRVVGEADGLHRDGGAPLVPERWTELVEVRRLRGRVLLEHALLDGVEGRPFVEDGDVERRLAARGRQLGHLIGRQHDRLRHVSVRLLLEIGREDLAVDLVPRTRERRDDELVLRVRGNRRERGNGEGGAAPHERPAIDRWRHDGLLSCHGTSRSRRARPAAARGSARRRRRWRTAPAPGPGTVDRPAPFRLRRSTARRET